MITFERFNDQQIFFQKVTFYLYEIMQNPNIIEN